MNIHEIAASLGLRAPYVRPSSFHKGAIFEIDGSAAEIRIAANHTICSRAVLHKKYQPTLVDLNFHRKHREEYLELADRNNLIKIFRTGEDVHTMGTSMIMDLPKSEITDELRSGGKFCTLGRMYGRGSKAIAQQYGVDEAVMADRIARWDKVFPEFTKLWHPAVKHFVHEFGFVTSLFNLVRRIPDIWHEDPMWVAKAEREGINSPVQGDSHMWISKAASWFQVNVLEKYSCKSVLINDVHDAYLVDVHPDEFEFVGIMMGVSMMRPFYEIDEYPFMVCPLASDLKVQRPWGTQFVKVKYDTAFFEKDTTARGVIGQCERAFYKSIPDVSVFFQG